MSLMRFRQAPAPITTGTSIKTLIQLLALTNQRIKVGEFSISFNG